MPTRRRTRLVRSTKRILCIDDETTGLMARKLLLEHEGYEVFACDVASEGLAVFLINQIHLVVLDYSMPELNGKEVALAMRQKKPRIPILLLSGSPEAASETATVVDGFLEKGSGAIQLLATVRQLLDRAA